MKIKEVIARTGLTDRAVRLYIDNGLVEPCSDVSYSGRKNIDFSEDDVKRLCDIAILRKAGFGISDIKAIITDKAMSKGIIKSFIAEKKEDIEKYTRVIRCLENISDNEDLTIDVISRYLRDSVSEVKLPSEDIKFSVGERIERIIYVVVAVVGMIISGSFIYLTLLFYNTQFQYPVLSEDWQLYIFNFLALMTFVFPLMLFIIRLKSKGRRTKLKVRVISIALSVLSILSAVYSPMLTSLNFFVPIVYSQTEDPKNYLLLDEGFPKYAVHGFFPSVIPRSAVIEGRGFAEDRYPETTIYFYRYRENVETDYDIVAEWKLPEEEYYNEILRMLEKTDEESYETKKGKWNCLYYSNSDETDISTGYYFKIFAFDDSTRRVRYIISYSLEGAENEPYYFSLEW